MILSKDDLREYIYEDTRANGFDKSMFSFFNYTRKYLRCLRIVEYYTNTKCCKLLYSIYRMKLYRLSLKTGITIGVNSFGKGLYLPHHGYIVVNSTARFGDNCVVQCGVNISENAKGGNHIYLATGAKILSDVYIADDIIVGANAVVTKSFMEPNIVLGGIPARKISDNGYKNRKKI